MNEVLDEVLPDVVASKKQPVALDIGLDNDNMKNEKMRKFEEFKARQRLREEMRKEKAAARRDSSADKAEAQPQANMPKYGLKKP